MSAHFSKPGFFRSAIDAMMQARQREADRYVSKVLLSLDDRTLAASGYDRAELRRRAR